MKKRKYRPRPWIEHGGSLSIAKRKSSRPIHTNRCLHVTLRSDLARGKRSLLKNRRIVHRIVRKAARNFDVKVHRKAICSNHIHLLIKGKTREDIQNFFRVVAGHIAQEILRKAPLTLKEKKAHHYRRRGKVLYLPRAHERGYRRRFWDLLLYSRVVRWGNDYATVKRYIRKNHLEAAGKIPYSERVYDFYIPDRLNTS